jgi:hypothetical protein
VREMRLALALGYDRIEAALLESADPESCRDDAWRHNDPPPIPQMTAPEALQLLHLHHKTARLGWSHYDYRKLRGIPRELRSAFLADRWQDRMARELENEAVAAVDESGPRSPHEPPAPMLPALDQVTGWSKADPAKAPHDPRKPMFGGWRIGDWKGRE